MTLTRTYHPSFRSIFPSHFGEGCQSTAGGSDGARLFILLIFACASLGLSAATPSAKSVLDKTSGILTSYPSCTASFTATATQGSTSGTITVQGRKFFVKSPESLVWFDGTTQWMMLTGSKEVNVTTPTAAELQQMNPYYFLNLYKSGFDLKMRSEGANYVVTMTSQKKKGLKQMEVTINQKTYLPSRVVMTSQRGSKTTVTISNIKKGKKQSENLFRFNKKEHPKVQVIDLR